ncbi:helix-turn-helix domain-containing protein [Spirosoma arcticum]
MKTISQLLVEQREQKGVTQAQLSVLAGIKQPHLARIEQGESKPTMPIVFRICEALSIDPLTLADELANEFSTYVKDRFTHESSLVTRP